MARIAHFRKILKDNFFKRIKFFAEFLSARDILDAAAAENYHWRNRIWTPIQTLWAFLVQVLEPDCPCREAVAHILAEQAACGQQVTASPDPSAYCQGRQRLPLSLFKSALRQVGQRLQAKVGSAYSWCGRRVWIVDGSTCSMPDTPSQRDIYALVSL
jgi:hypothetical protein